MANPLYNQLGNENNTMAQFMSEFQRLQQTVKNPKQEVERLLQSGQMSQSQFNNLSKQAKQILAMMPKK